jgi:hypothetical protein
MHKVANARLGVAQLLRGGGHVPRFRCGYKCGVFAVCHDNALQFRFVMLYYNNYSIAMSMHRGIFN